MTETELRDAHYNASVVSVRQVHDDLLVMRILSDQGPVSFLPGQYTVLGLGNWEPYVNGENSIATSNDTQAPQLIRRAYSFSAAMVDDTGQLLPPNEQKENEFYIALVRGSATHPPSLTPRIFHLVAGSRIHLGPRARGTYTLARVAPTDTLVLCATGTGEAPHNTMIADRLAAGHPGRIIVVVCVRHWQDLAYLDAHRILQSRFPNYQYLALTTREPENLDASHPNYVGKRHLQQYFRSGELERDAQFKLQPGETHVYLCGNPAMIGTPNTSKDAVSRYPEPVGMVEVLEQRGFVIDSPRSPGNIHFEKYW